MPVFDQSGKMSDWSVNSSSISFNCTSQGSWKVKGEVKMAQAYVTWGLVSVNMSI